MWYINMIDDDYNILISLFSLPSKLKLFISDNREEIFNTSLPDKEELLKRINKLIKLGLIYCKDEENAFTQKTIISKVDINIILCLTLKGGELIEKKLNINWDEYIYEEVGYKEKDIYEVTIQSNDFKKINKVADFLPHKYKKLEIKKLIPWFPVYWKKLSVGYKITILIPEKDYVSHLQNNEDYLQLVHPFYLT